MSLSSKPIFPPHTPVLAAPALRVEHPLSFWQRLANAIVARVPKRWVSNYILSRQVQMTIDGTVVALSFVLAHVLRFDGWPPAEDAHRLWFMLPYVVAARVFVSYYTGIYKRIWRYVSINDASQLAGAVGIVSALLLALRLLFEDVYGLLLVPIGTIAIDFMLATGGMMAVRLCWRVACENASRATTRRAALHQRALLVGAGDAGVMAAREITRRPDLGLRVCGFVDDDHAKRNTIIQGVKVLGKTEDLPRLADLMQVDQVIITIANTNRKTIRRILDLCESVKVPVRIIPGLYEIIGNHVTISNVRPVEIEDLLGRDAIDVDAWLAASQDSYSLRRVLVTGAGGSIGRELCRQLAILKPSSIILLDKDENSVFEAERELRAALDSKHTTEIVPVICDLRSERRLYNVFDKHRPQVVFHAAAHKHVPMMEANPAEAIKNNVLATRLVGELAGEFATEVFVMISTDKAVRPSSMMGASKRVAELVVQDLNRKWNTRYVAVRFGNVIGSAGSVLNIFSEQIRKGGPVTITHPEMVRYFMTIPEASQLVLEASAIGKGGEIFILDRGEPVKILDLAKDMITLSGLRPYEDIDIKVTGIRPGEKLFEELSFSDEAMAKTRHPKIYIGKLAAYSAERMQAALQELTMLATSDGREKELRQFLNTFLPEATVGEVWLPPTTAAPHPEPVAEETEQPRVITNLSTSPA